MKDSGIKWIGSIPDTWDVIKVKYNCSLKGRIGWQGLTTDEYIDEGPFLITGTDFNVNEGKINWDSCVHVSEWRYDQAPEIQVCNGDLLITKDGTVGKVAIVTDMQDKTTLNSGVMVIRPTEDSYETKFLYYVLKSEEFWKWFNYINSGNTLAFPNAKYYDLYANGTTINDQTAYNRSHLGDATGETKSWYDDNSYFISAALPWFLRGGYYSNKSITGIFNFYNIYGNNNYNYTFRSVLTVTK